MAYPALSELIIMGDQPPPVGTGGYSNRTTDVVLLLGPVRVRIMLPVKELWLTNGIKEILFNADVKMCIKGNWGK
jgi:hypothetical protein